MRKEEFAERTPLFLLHLTYLFPILVALLLVRNQVTVQPTRLTTASNTSTSLPPSTDQKGGKPANSLTKEKNGT